MKLAELMLILERFEKMNDGTEVLFDRIDLPEYKLTIIPYHPAYKDSEKLLKG